MCLNIYCDGELMTLIQDGFLYLLGKTQIICRVLGYSSGEISFTVKTKKSLLHIFHMMK